jgi:hypothetical protein
VSSFLSAFHITFFFFLLLDPLSPSPQGRRSQNPGWEEEGHVGQSAQGPQEAKYHRDRPTDQGEGERFISSPPLQSSSSCFQASRVISLFTHPTVS